MRTCRLLCVLTGCLLVIGCDDDSAMPTDAAPVDAIDAAVPDAHDVPRDAAVDLATADDHDAATTDAHDAAPVDGNDAAPADASPTDADVDASPSPCAGVVCTASDQCHTAGTCNPVTGVCSNPPKPDGSACTDGNACTQTDTCQSGACVGSNPVTCAALDQCHTAGTCDTSTGVCSTPPKSDGSACNDGNACTQTDTCQSGACVGANPVTCAALDQCHAAGTCDTSTGACSTPPKSDGSACNDGNACTQNDTCQSGVCTGANPVTCAALDQCHTAGTCAPSTGVCSNPPKSDGSACNDGSACTQNDTCQTGVCTGTACASGICDTSLTAFTGASTATWNLNGTAFYDGTTNTVVLVPGGQNNSAGTALYQNAIPTDTFDVTFDFRVDTSTGRADGLGFLIETDGPTALGSIGSGLGMTNLHGYGVELDIYDNGECGDGNGNHAGVDSLSPSCGAGEPTPLATSPDLYDSAVPGGGIGDIGDGQWRTAVVHFASSAISVTVNGTAVPNLQGVALPGFVSGSSYYFGFSAGTGGLSARHEIRNVQITFPTARCL